jgi:hypothetical protein
MKDEVQSEAAGPCSSLRAAGFASIDTSGAKPTLRGYAVAAHMATKRRHVTPKIRLVARLAA